MSRNLAKGQDNPFLDQVGGSHYVDMGMQPFEFTFPNGYDGIAHTIFKYVARHKAKGKAADLKKAAHCISLRAVDLDKNPLPPVLDEVTLAMFFGCNACAPDEISFFEMLHFWLQHPERTDLPEVLIDKLGRMIISHYAPTPEED